MPAKKVAIRRWQIGVRSPISEDAGPRERGYIATRKIYCCRSSPFDHARKLMQAKDIAEVVQLQTDFLRQQFGVATGQLKHMAGDVTSTNAGPACEAS